MPTYAFRCECGHSFELVRPITAYPKNPPCPACEHRTAKRVFELSIPRFPTDIERPVSQRESPPSRLNSGETVAIRLEDCTNGTVSNCVGYGVDVLIDAENCAGMTYENNVNHPPDR